jgi:drug/metabolite transporter (DMT)-like permease
VIYGLGAALGWGFADVGAALVGRRLGSLATAVLAQVASLLAVGVLVLVLRPEWTMTTSNVLVLAVNGVVVAAAYLTLYRALELGPIALVSPVVAAYAVPPVVLAVILLDESLAGLVLAGAVVTLVGVVLASLDLRQIAGGRGSGAGLSLAVVSMLLFGLVTFVLARQAQVIGWLPSMAIGRAFSVSALLVVAAVKRPSLRGAGASGVASAALVGLADIFGVAMFSFGAEAGLISIVTAASATFVLIPVVWGVAFFHERPAATQLAGVALVVGGLLLLGLG